MQNPILGEPERGFNKVIIRDYNDYRTLAMLSGLNWYAAVAVDFLSPKILLVSVSLFLAECSSTIAAISRNRIKKLNRSFFISVC